MFCSNFLWNQVHFFQKKLTFCIILAIFSFCCLIFTNQKGGGSRSGKTASPVHRCGPVYMRWYKCCPVITKKNTWKLIYVIDMQLASQRFGIFTASLVRFWMVLFRKCHSQQIQHNGDITAILNAATCKV